MKSVQTPDGLYNWTERNGVQVVSSVPRYSSFWWDHLPFHFFMSYKMTLKSIIRDTLTDVRHRVYTRAHDTEHRSGKVPHN